MKNIIFMILLFAAFSVSAQQRNVSITLDTVKGAETLYFAPTYTSTFTGATEYIGIVVFQYTTKDIKDSLASIYLQGSNDGTNYVNVTNQAKTTTDGTYSLSQAPPAYLKYRLATACIAGDTVVVKNITYTQKK